MTYQEFFGKEISQLSILHSHSGTGSMTPFSLCERIVTRAIDFTDWNQQVVDPCCGKGSFLLATIKGFLNAGCPADHLVNNIIHGYDIDPGQLRATRIAIKRVTGLSCPNIQRKDFLTHEINMINPVVLSNPPYNDGSAGRNPIYQKFLTKIIELNPIHLEIIIPSNWFSQDHNKLGKEVRDSLLQLGVHTLTTNNPEIFGDGATVNTVTASCKKGYYGDITLTDGTTSRIINSLEEQILYNTDEVGVNLLERLRPANPYTTYQGIKGNTDSWRIVTSYRKERFDIDPLATLKLMPPNNTSQGSYRVFAEFATQEEAEKALEFYKSFWHSKLIKFVMCQTRNSTTLDNPQLRWVPVMETIDKVYTDEDLYNYFNLNDEEIEYVENNT